MSRVLAATMFGNIILGAVPEHPALPELDTSGSPRPSGSETLLMQPFEAVVGESGASIGPEFGGQPRIARMAATVWVTDRRVVARLHLQGSGNTYKGSWLIGGSTSVALGYGLTKLSQHRAQQRMDEQEQVTAVAGQYCYAWCSELVYQPPFTNSAGRPVSPSFVLRQPFDQGGLSLVVQSESAELACQAIARATQAQPVEGWSERLNEDDRICYQLDPSRLEELPV